MTKSASEIQCPVHGYYCLGDDTKGCIDKPKLVEIERQEMTPQPPPLPQVDREELRQKIESIELPVPKDMFVSHNITVGQLIGDRVMDKIMALFDQYLQVAVRKHEGIGAYLAISRIDHHVGYLLAHRAQGLPIMTSKVIGELWSDMKEITSENVQYMRSSPRNQPNTPNNDKERL